MISDLSANPVAEPITVNVISMGLLEIGLLLLETRTPRFWRCLRRGLADFFVGNTDVITLHGNMSMLPYFITILFNVKLINKP